MGQQQVMEWLEARLGLGRIHCARITTNQTHLSLVMKLWTRARGMTWSIPNGR